MLQVLADFLGCFFGTAAYFIIAGLIKRDISQSQSGGRGSVQVQVGGSIKGDAKGEFELSRCDDSGCTCTHY